MQTVLMRNPQETYLKQGILTASPLELIIMLYDGLRKNILLGGRAIEKNDMAAAHKHLIKAQSIVTELINSLDTTIAISEELFDLYEFMLKQLAYINTRKDAQPINDLLEIVTILRDTWKEVNETQRGGLVLEEAQG